jgi:hypothetical protein
MSEDLQEKMKSIFEKEKLNEFKKIYEKSSQNELMNYENNNIYPLHEDPNFILKISSKQEFQDTKYDGSIKKTIEEIRKYSEFLCNTKFELNPHQSFIKNFLSFQTPYNSLLLYHGLGSGKTCTAIGVAEEARSYLKQLNINRRIIVVASPNVQDNFKIQLFDERKLELNNGFWNLNACTGNELLNEINPMNIKGISKEKIIKQINQIINKYYIFMGYTKFANYIDKAIGDDNAKNLSNVAIKKIKKMFEDRLIIIDEVHNIRSISSRNEEKRISNNLNKLVKYTDNLHLLLLSATPIYNNYKEIIYLINLLNLNDKKSEVKVSEIFDNSGNFIIDDDGYEVGKTKFIEKTRGYVSFVRGDNPYTFPFRIFPYQFDKNHSLKTMRYPEIQFNEDSIVEPLQYIDTYNVEIGHYQGLAYDHVISKLKKKSSVNELINENISSIGYSKLQIPIELLNMTYPNIDFDENYGDRDFIFVGKKGLSNVMSFEENNNVAVPYRSNFTYNENYFQKYGRIFSKENIGKYSCKIAKIIENIEKSDGISLVYSQYIDGGITPVVLALEELGYSRYGDVKSLYSDSYKRKLGISNTNKKYIMITGDKYFSPNKYKNDELKAITDDSNKDGNKIKVVFISKSGSEGIDFKFIRNVHIMEPWYNMNRLEQIIGRAVRNCSHKLLPLEKRNVCIYLYSTLLKEKIYESMDNYVYRLAEKKAIQIGNITRLLKQSSVDCLLNVEQNNFSFEKMSNIEIPINLSNNETINFKIGDKPYTSVCDYQDSCYYKCLYIDNDKMKEIDKIPKNTDNTYNLTNMLRSNSVLINKIRQLFQEKYFYTKKDLFFELNKIKKYPAKQIYSALNKLIENKNNFLLDKYNRIGHLINVDNIYLYQPGEMDDDKLNMYERVNPINYKNSSIKIKINEIKDSSELNISNESYNYNIDIAEIKKIYDNIFEAKNNPLEINNFTMNYINEFIPDKKILEKLIIHHVFDYLDYSKKIGIIEYFQKNKEKGNFEKELKKYSENYIIKNDISIAFIHPYKNDYDLYIKYNEENNWKKGKEGDRKFILNNIKSKYLINDFDNYEDIVGFISNILYKNSNTYLLKLKIKNMSDKKSLGTTFDSSPKRKVVELISTLTYKEFISSIKNVTNEKLSLFVELILRYKNLTKPSFITLNEYIINKKYNKDKIKL